MIRTSADLFAKEIQQKLYEHNFELICPEENIWILDEGDCSVTVSGGGKFIEAIWQNFEGKYADLSNADIDTVLKWADEKMS